MAFWLSLKLSNTSFMVLINFCREKNELNESLMKLQGAVTQFREKEAEASLKVKRSLDIVDQAQFEKAQVYSVLADGYGIGGEL